MSHCPSKLHAEFQPSVGTLIEALDPLRRRHSVEGAVQFQGVEFCRVVFKEILSFEAGGIEASDEFRVVVAACAYEYVRHLLPL